MKNNELFFEDIVSLCNTKEIENIKIDMSTINFNELVAPTRNGKCNFSTIKDNIE